MLSNLFKITTVLALLVFAPNLFSKVSSDSTRTQSHNILDVVITELADELSLYNKINGVDEEITITSFVDLHQLNRTTDFGRTISEAFFDELFTRGFNVTDFRGQETISINANGEYFLTRDIKLLDKDVVSAYILVGTYSYFENKIQINARIIDNMSGKVLASARSHYLTSDCRVLKSCKKPRAIQIVKHDSKISNKKDYAKVDNKTINNRQSFIRKQQKANDEEIVVTKTRYPLVNLIK